MGRTRGSGVPNAMTAMGMWLTRLKYRLTRKSIAKVDMRDVFQKYRTSSANVRA